MKIPVALLGLALLVNACTTIDYVPYSGAQQDWPTRPGAFVKECNGIQIYHGLPAKPYTVIGRVVTDADSESQLSRIAKSHGADALIITDAETFSSGSVYFPGSSTTYQQGNLSGHQYSGTSSTYTMPGLSLPITETVVTVWLIKFK